MKILTNNTKRAFDDLKIGIKRIRVSRYSELYSSDLKELLKNKLAHVFYKDKNYVFFYYAKNAFNTNHELFLNCFNENDIATHTVDELDLKYRVILFKAIESSQYALKEYLGKSHKAILRIYSYQHIGNDELNDYEFKTTYPQTHWHIYALNREDIDNGKMLNHSENCYLNTFYDFFIDVYAELLEINISKINYDLCSITLLERPLSLNIKEKEIELINDVMIRWKLIWKNFSTCFTAFESSKQGRFLLRSRDITLKLLKKVCEKYGLTSNSTERLLWLANNIQNEAKLDDSTLKEYWRTLHKGINGSIGFVHDFEKEKTFINVAPRTFATKERIGCLDKLYFCKKNRNEYLSKKEILTIRNIQKKMYSMINKKK